MNPSFYTALLVGLALALVAMYAFGFYWLATKDKLAHSGAPPSRILSSTSGRRSRPDRSCFTNPVPAYSSPPFDSTRR